MLKVSAITLYQVYIFKATPPFNDTLVKERLWQLHFLVLAHTWNFSSGKPSSDLKFPKHKQQILRIQIWAV